MSESRYEEMLESDGDSIALVIQRPIEAQAKYGLDTTFSADVLDEIAVAVTTWVGTRVVRYHDAHGLMPQTIRIALTVQVEA
jgi:hypothetical protein